MPSSRPPTESRAEAPVSNLIEWTVSELSAALKRTVEDAYGFVRVRGEVSGFKGPSPSGHCYFRLKDDRAVIEGVIWKGVYGRMRVKPEEGLDVIATGKLTTFPGSSKYQIVIDSLEPAGVGALMKLLEERKKKLAAEGLFDEARKQLIPFLPEVIGVVTSPTGAVIRDILHRLADRFPRHVLVWPVRVQGEQSAAEVAAAIDGFNALPEGGPIPRPELIIVARGGGSLEDLWSFNEEIVVRAAAASMIPLISAVGHETDITLIDFASDRRAPTPTAAAEMAVPVRSELLQTLNGLASRKLACWQRGMERLKRELTMLTRALPKDILADPRQRLDSLSERLPRALRANAHVHHTQYTRVATRLSPPLLINTFERRKERYASLNQRLKASLLANAQAHHARIERARERVTAFGERGKRATAALLKQHHTRIERAERLLAAFSYREVLKRGFALVRDEHGQPLRAAAQVSAGAMLDIEFADGRVAATAEGGPTVVVRETVVTETTVVEVTPKPPAKPKKPRDEGGGGQGSLFG
ncbi:exodeoxyribonuclease VII large subunit [Pseudolabrys sp. Root1462]|uniref:exodeoxyribonuclease VII large subunit n=1 Tax=Pseudolabrys sp. Root1462 TaxID=1736466 RepID=UPI00070259C5|nr:exodeoxyribonuclease VII large subunit [Pseudolabrys sp. Root1462]KQY99939.1 exodeoxyribonuclease VII large subunit [Pseudolabrys sp. Root1462]